MSSTTDEVVRKKPERCCLHETEKATSLSTAILIVAHLAKSFFLNNTKVGAEKTATGASLSRKERQVRTQLHRLEVHRERPDVLPLWY